MLKWTKETPQCTFLASQMARVTFELGQSDFGGQGGCYVEVFQCTWLLAAAFLWHTVLVTTTATSAWPCAFISRSCIRSHAPSALPLFSLSLSTSPICQLRRRQHNMWLTQSYIYFDLTLPSNLLEVGQQVQITKIGWQTDGWTVWSRSPSFFRGVS